MAMQSSGPKAPERAAPELWYARDPQAVASAFGVDPTSGLTAARVTELLAENGPNALPEEKSKPAWRRWREGTARIRRGLADREAGAEVGP